MKHLVLVLVLSLMPFMALAGALPASPYVQVTGHGSLTVVPDMAHITVSVENTDKDLALARGDVERRAAAVIAAAGKLGVAERDISAANISIWPEYQWQNNRQVFTGQHVSRRIVITLRNLGHYADLIGALVRIGVTTFNATLDRSDMPELRREALAQAVEDAHARALALVAAAGQNLGAVYSISETSAFIRPQPVMMAAKMESRESAEYQPGTMEISADVNVVYLIKAAH